VKRGPGGDAGITMIEVVSSMVVMSIVLVIFTTGFLQVMGSANRVQTLAEAQSQVNIAFLRLDKEIRYAAAIGQEGTVGTDWYVEYLTTNTGSRVCTELRLHASQLQRRTWTQPAPPAVPGPGNVTPTTWAPLVSNVSSTAPFTFSDADSTMGFQRLELKLTAGDAAAGVAKSRQTDVTFTALNTSLQTQGDDDECREGRSIP
jgi:Tfp pilus assembly protein PilV